MTQHGSNSGTVNLTGAEYAVMMARIETLIAQNTEARNGFQRYMERNGDRVSALEKQHIETDTVLRLTREEVTTLRTRGDQLAILQVDQGNRTTALETTVSDLSEIKRMVTASLVGVVVTFIGSAIGIGYLIANRIPIP